tara:strand:+ start:15828 stop:20795 length:4968 start_codon:yes stop_codon:yes gene_type:complete
MNKLFYFFLLLFSSIEFSQAQNTFTSVQTGDWNDGSTWSLSAGAGGVEGVDFPAPTDFVIISDNDTVYIDFGTTGILYQYEGFMTIDTLGLLWVTVGDNNNGFALINNGKVFNYGKFYTGLATEGPGTPNPFEIDIYLEDNAIFYAFEGSENYCSDDIHIRDRAIFYTQVNVCIEIDDDFHLQGTNSLLCGDGGASIGASTVDNEVIFESGANSNNICNGLTVFRGTGGTCNPTTGVPIVTGTGPSNLRPVAINDNLTVFQNTAATIDVLKIGINDFDFESDTIGILQAGNNVAINDNQSFQGGTLSINNNGTPTDPRDDYVDYTPPLNFVGFDSFRYILEDLDGAFDTALVSLKVICVNGFITEDTVIYPGVITSVAGVGNSGNILGAIDGLFADWFTNGNTLVFDFGSIQAVGTKYLMTWRERTGETGTAIPIIEESTDNVNYFLNNSSPSTNSTVAISDTITSQNEFRYLRISKDNPPSTTDFQIDAVGLVEFNCSGDIDTDGDGVFNFFDIDDDNDGILDIDEEGFVSGSLNYEFYDLTPPGNTVDNIPTTGALSVGTVNSFDVDALQAAVDPGDPNNYSIRFSGFINILVDATYTFYTNSDDGSKLFINGIEVVDNDGNHAAAEESGTIFLTTGVYPISVLYYEAGGDEILEVSYSSATIGKTFLPFSILSTIENNDLDSDGDGIIDRLDLDADNDGIPDIVEAGGVDADGDGMVDTFVDTDGDGWANTFDPDNGGTPLSDGDSDGDGFPNRIDIDSDNDGIIDNIEAQASTSTPIVPSGSDADGDGIDDAFDPDLSNSLLVPVNTDGTDEPDYLDTDSDNDGYSDLIEAYDTSNNNIANTNLSGTDSDNDGLDDAFDLVNGINSSSNVTNGTQTSEDFPNLDDPDTPERDWRELLDTDNDGIADYFDIDKDNDGILDADENSGCSSAGNLNYEFYDLVPTGNTVDNISSTGALSVGIIGTFNVNTLQNAVDPGDPNTFSIRYTGFINIDSAGTYTFFTTSDDGSKLFINGTEVVNNDGLHGNQERSGSIVLSGGFHSIRVLFFENTGGQNLSVSYQGPSISKTLLPFSILSTSALCDSDGDGIPDERDLDSENDGIPDIVEAGGIDSDNNGVVDGVFTDTDADGWSNVFDPDNGGTPLTDPDSDGDGYTNRVDLDSDNDGLTDIVEAGGVDTDEDGRVDASSDTDNDGWADTFDSDNGGTVLEDGDFDADGVLNRLDLDSDNDGIQDIVEAGGVDANGNARVDATLDSDGDGWANTFDSDNGGTTLADEDSDGDGLPNRFDLDSDNDGLIDNVEAQTTAAFQAPLGTDTDGDGWDNRYDSDNGGTAITLSDADSDGIPDYLDLDADGDGLADWIEGFDDNGSGDALDDFIIRADDFELAAGNPLYYVNIDDADTDGIPDWLEDDDSNGRPNFLQASHPLYQDTDGDGLIDLYDADNFGAASNLPDLDNDGEYDFRDTDNQISLPITLLYFNAIKQGEQVLLKWATTSEINNDFFTIERSQDARNFRPILKHTGAGNSQVEIHYERYDKNPLQGTNYYRLRQTDFNGETKEFPIEVVQFNPTRNSIRIYPNPGDGNLLNLEFANELGGETIYISINSANGQKILARELIALPENVTTKIEILNGMKLTSGIYIVKIEFDSKQKLFKYIVF